MSEQLTVAPRKTSRPFFEPDVPGQKELRQAMRGQSPTLPCLNPLHKQSHGPS